MVVKPYERLDVARLQYREGDDWGGFNEASAHGGFSFTLWENNEPIASMGVASLYPHVGALWMVVTDAVRGHGVAFTKRCRALLVIAMRDMQLHRVQAFVKADKPEYVRWAKLLGFKVEGRMVKGTADQRDMYLMAKVI